MFMPRSSPRRASSPKAITLVTCVVLFIAVLSNRADRTDATHDPHAGGASVPIGWHSQGASAKSGVALASRDCKRPACHLPAPTHVVALINMRTSPRRAPALLRNER
jgi:hypothetical protein